MPGAGASNFSSDFIALDGTVLKKLKHFSTNTY